MSFAGEDRAIVENVADNLDRFQVRVFYDEWEKHKLVGEDLYTYLADIYENRASYCAMFISRAYVSKAWPRHERRFAQARAFSSRRPYILPIRLDGTRCPGIPSTVGFIDARKTKPEAIAVLLLRRLGKELYRGDDDTFMLKRLMQWRVFWNGTVRAKGTFRMLHLGRELKKRITFNIWSPDERPLSLKDVAVTVGRRRLAVSAPSVVQTSRECRATLPRPLAFGDVLNYQFSYCCPGYYKDVSEVCRDQFKTGYHMLKWEYKFVFPRNSVLSMFELCRRVGRQNYLQSYGSAIEQGCPVVYYERSRPLVGSELSIAFKVGRP